MHARVMRITASVGCWIAASGMLSMRTSCALGMVVARISFCSREIQIFVVGHVLHPRDRRAVERFLDGDVGHRGGVGRTVPVLVMRRAPDHVAGADLDRLLALPL